MIKNIIVLLFLLVFSAKSFGLNIDAKIKLKFLGVSDSKKTVLANRGSEHGLEVGNHAKISLPTGMIARGVVVKVAPSRSVWSLYRFFKKEKIENGIVVSAKIASPVKLTADESKHLGVMSAKYGKRDTDKVPVVSTKDQVLQKKLKKHFINKDRVVSQYDNIDYTNLEDQGKFIKPSVDVDWEGLDGKKDKDYVNSSIDYSALH